MGKAPSGKRGDNVKYEYIFYMNTTTAERSKASTFYDRLNIEIAGSNPAQGMDVCLRVSVLCCRVCR
jgi:hypothetical protein